MDFQAGQRVRCVNARGWEDLGGAPGDGPALSDICTVLEVGVDPALGLALRLIEHPLNDGAPSGFDAREFRPLEDGELERLRSLCAGVRSGAEASA